MVVKLGTGLLTSFPAFAARWIAIFRYPKLRSFTEISRP
jgi:hypothetical protein